MIGTPHTTKVGHTFPLVNIRVHDLYNKPEYEHCAKTYVFFFSFFLNSLGNTHVTTLGLRETVRGDPRPSPSLGLESGPRENAVDPPKTQVSLVRMRPREFSLRVPTWTRLEGRLLI